MTQARDPKLLDWIDGLKPEIELPMRRAMCAVFPEIAADRLWMARIAALEAELARDPESQAHFQREAEKAERLIREATAQDAEASGPGR
jgi:hypothetical protein